MASKFSYHKRRTHKLCYVVRFWCGCIGIYLHRRLRMSKCLVQERCTPKHVQPKTFSFSCVNTKVKPIIIWTKERTDTALRLNQIECKVNAQQSRPICFVKCDRSRWNTSQTCIRQKTTWKKWIIFFFFRMNECMMLKIVLVLILLRIFLRSILCFFTKTSFSLALCTACSWFEVQMIVRKVISL